MIGLGKGDIFKQSMQGNKKQIIITLTLKEIACYKVSQPGYQVGIYHSSTVIISMFFVPNSAMNIIIIIIITIIGCYQNIYFYLNLSINVTTLLNYHDSTVVVLLSSVVMVEFNGYRAPADITIILIIIIIKLSGAYCVYKPAC